MAVRPRLLGVTRIRRRYTTVAGRLRFHWTGERVLSGRPTVFEHRWEHVLHTVDGEGFGVPAWVRWDGFWVLAWPCVRCGGWDAVPAAHRCRA